MGYPTQKTAPKPGRPPGSKNALGHAAGRPPTTQTLADLELIARATLLLRHYKQADLVAALGLPLRTWQRRLSGCGSFTPEQLAAGRAFLSQVSQVRIPPA